MENEIGQIFFIGLEGKTLQPHEAEFMIKNNIGGVTLFARNLESPEQIHALCSSLYHLHSKTPSKLPPFIAIDMEGGRVHRLKAPFTQWPAFAKITKIDSTSIAFKFANFMGKELHAAGINLNFSPCVDVLTNPKNVLIGDRSFSSDPEVVSKMASAIVRGLIKASVVPCAKHFPGHGNTIIDSHEDLPVEEVDEKTLFERELLPFRTVFRARLDFVMTAHVLYKNVDAKNPATLSKKILKDILRDQVRYRELAISDDLDMKALTKHYDRKEIPVLALEAGCNVLLYCNDFTSPPIGIEAVKAAVKSNRISMDDISATVKKLSVIKQEYFSAWRPMDFKTAATLIGHPDHLRLAKSIADGVVSEDLLRT